MKLSKLIEVIESEETFCNYNYILELQKRKKQIKAFFNVDEIKVLSEYVSNAVSIFLIDVDFDRTIDNYISNFEQSDYDIIKIDVI